jgi:hypothetical protein
MTELIQNLILNQRRYCVEDLAGKLDTIVTLAGQIKDCTNFDNLRNLLKEIAEEACYTAKDIEETFKIDE